MVSARVRRTIDCTSAKALRARWSTSRANSTWRSSACLRSVMSTVTPLMRTMLSVASTLATAVPMHQRSSPFGRQTRNSLWKLGVLGAAGLIAFCRCFQSSGWMSALILSTVRSKLAGSTPKIRYWPSSHTKWPLTGSHVTGGQRQAATLFALHQPRGRGLQFRRSLGDATLELLVELFELPGFAIELGEDPDLGAQHFGNDWHRDVIDRAHFIGAQAVDVGQMDGGNEDDRGALKARMLANHRGQLEAVEFGHAHVHEDDGDVMLEEVFERLFGRGSLDEPLAELGQDSLVAQEFGWLVVD